VTGSAPLEKAGAVRLKIEANDAKCSFSYATESGPWKTLVADADAKMLTSGVAGGFVGATVGPHARIEP
jgi:alpha-N-arabinofuranosidase